MEIKKKIKKYLLLIFGLAIFTVYFLPVFGLIINIGNIFGMAVGIILILAFVFFEKLDALYKKVTSTKIGICVTAVVSAVVCAFVGMFGFALVQVISSARYTATNEKTVIVLGCRVYGTEPSNQLKSRCDTAVDYLKKNHEAVAILTGGQGEDEDISEAQCLYNLMKEKGIDEKRLFIEDKSTSTEENIKFAKEIIDENDLSTSVAIATSDYNERRAYRIALNYSLLASSIPSTSGFYSIPTYYTREAIALLVMSIFGK